jgi:RNA polymerase sigma-70 factor (ECF subfamily)
MLSELEEAIPDTAEPTSEDGEVTNLLNRFLEGLDPETRVLFLRRYVVGETVEALAERFGMGENAVASRLYRARVKLKKQLRKENIRI